ncbi:Gx transporter family protein [Butyricicoccus sp. AM27-36]|uniref:Gx transporter family protein n=1 Tax=Butyricicoccus sp. AM27-36 TaxID=2292293 RepID=UPI000E4D0350|nr:Gx transporter family protein [Butyricicoccus sp. AM27-36]RHT89743.1 heptaprenyl diphosphate synthase [Butyricicoccus sp. AM27-36]
MKNAKRLTLCGMLAAMAVVLSLVERMFPLDAIVPVPGVKLGLANVVTLFALTRLSARDAFAIVVTRVAISSLLMGSVSAFLFSLFGGLLSLIVMGILLKAEGRFCSLFGVSVGGAAAHNIGQMAAAVIWLKNWAVIAYLPFLLVMSVPLGLVTGLTCSVVLHHLKKIDFGA